MRISDWSSDVCSSDLLDLETAVGALLDEFAHVAHGQHCGVVVGVDVGRTQGFGLGGQDARGQEQHGRRGQRGAFEGVAQHCLPPGWEYGYGEGSCGNLCMTAAWAREWRPARGLAEVSRFLQAAGAGAQGEDGAV